MNTLNTSKFKDSGSVFFSLCLYAFALILMPFGLFCAEELSEGLARRVRAHLIIHDYGSAIEEASAALHAYPHSLPLWEAYVTALAESGREAEACGAWKQYHQMAPQEARQKELLETLCWCSIRQGTLSPSPIIRVTALLAAFLSNDAKGVTLVKQQLRDRNVLIRATALELSAHLRDADLMDGVLALLQEESDRRVRLMAIEAVGMMQIKEARGRLFRLLADRQTPSEEVAVAAKSLVLMMEKPRRAEIVKLTGSERAGLRLLACELTAEFHFEEGADLLLPLTKDPVADVRAAAFLSLGIIRPKQELGQQVRQAALEGAGEIDDQVAVAAAWTLTLYDQTAGQSAFASLLNSPLKLARHTAAAALASTGHFGLPLMKKAFHTHEDPYVRANLAIGLIGLREEVASASDELYRALTQINERWMWEEFGVFSVLTPSRVAHDELTPNHPEVVNLQARLQLLRVLAVVKHPNAYEGAKKLFKEKTRGVLGLSAMHLLTEGDEESADLVAELLQDPDVQVRVQAGLVLALWGRGEEVVPVLEAAYPTADRETKEKILEGLGHIGNQASLPFLLTCMEESCQPLRIMAAAVMLQTLYH